MGSMRFNKCVPEPTGRSMRLNPVKVQPHHLNEGS
jgi:hypothetical protein